MPGRANVYWTSTVVDASPDHEAVVTIASVSGVAGLPMARNVLFAGTLAITTGADTTAFALTATSGLGAGTAFGTELELGVANPETALIVSFMFQGTIPVGSGPINLRITQTDATVDATITSVTAYCLVGD